MMKGASGLPVGSLTVIMQRGHLCLSRRRRGSEGEEAGIARGGSRVDGALCEASEEKIRVITRG